ncbi:MAG: chaperone modulator CbpM [Bacteroidota bacterium]
MGTVERMVNLHHELGVNSEGIDVIFNLLDRVERLQDELRTMRNRLGLYE